MAQFPLSRYTAQIRTEARQVFDCAIERQKQTIQDAAPVLTGGLKGSVEFGDSFGTPTTIGREIVATAEHAVYLEKGTKPHKISVRSARVLSNGSDIFGTVVNHPGSTKHVGWFSDTFEAWCGHVEDCRAG